MTAYSDDFEQKEASVSKQEPITVFLRQNDSLPFPPGCLTSRGLLFDVRELEEHPSPADVAPVVDVMHKLIVRRRG